MPERRRDLRAVRAFRAAVGLTLLFLSGPHGIGAEVTTVLVAPSQPIPAGSRAAVWLHYLNSSTQTVQRAFPAHLSGTLAADSKTTKLRLSQTEARSEVPAAIIPPGGFARQGYEFELPHNFTGTVLLSVAWPDANQIVLQVQAATVAAAPAEVAKDAPEPRELTKSDAESFFKRHFFPYEPLYVIGGSRSPNVKFQVSLKYRLVDPSAPLGRRLPPVSDLYVGYTQTSLWDWNAPSTPFYDTSYKPEIFYSRQKIVAAGAGEWFRLDLQSGLHHESNGRGGPESRSFNIVYLRPAFVFGREEKVQFTLGPRAWFYVGDRTDNPDLADYRGYADLVGTLSIHGVRFSTTFRTGDDGEHNSLQFDLKYPLRKLPWLGLTWYLHLQYFTGYGETLLHYNEKTSAFRFGFALFP